MAEEPHGRAARDAPGAREADGAGAVQPQPWVREQLLELAEASRLSLDVASYEWKEVAPGVRVHLLKQDPARGLTACLVWGRAGARHPRHRHLGDEVILVLRGRISDERGSYGPGEVCRSEAGSVHTEQADPREDCLCYVLYYGPLEMLPQEA
jgi:putative transcriptional regulator